MENIIPKIVRERAKREEKIIKEKFSLELEEKITIEYLSEKIDEFLRDNISKRDDLVIILGEDEYDNLIFEINRGHKVKEIPNPYYSTPKFQGIEIIEEENLREKGWIVNEREASEFLGRNERDCYEAVLGRSFLDE